jgi:hypothetical protein
MSINWLSLLPSRVLRFDLRIYERNVSLPYGITVTFQYDYIF